MFGNLLFAFWVFLPAGIANLTPVLANHVPLINKWDRPLDFGKHLGGQRIFGDNKTLRGLVCGVIVAGLVAVVEKAAFYGGISSIFFVYGAALGFGALAGDAVESFLKRRAGVRPGKLWFPFDQADYIIGALAFTYPLIVWPRFMMFQIFVIYFGLHLVVGYAGYLLKLKDSPV